MDDIAIRVEHVSKDFKLPHDRANSLKSSLLNVIKRRRGYEIQHALQNISFEVKKGEFYGIVGKNGGGKSTLLKIISRIYSPTKGKTEINGKLTPFIELGVGFNPELTGRENVFLNGALLGFNRKEMAAMYDDVVEFAELERFMDQKLKNYSSGMQVRLAFSIAIRAQSDILVMDEVLAVGDAAFQKKCFEIFRELKGQGRTIVLVTHDMANVERFCDRVLVIDEGKQLAITTPAEAASLYARLNVKDENLHANRGKSTHIRYGSGEITVQNARFLLDGKKTNVYAMGDDLILAITLERKASHRQSPVSCGLAFFNEDGVNVIGPNSEQAAIPDGATEFTFSLTRLMLTPGKYALSIALYDKSKPDVYYDFLDKWVSFSVVADHITHGLIELQGQWTAR